MFNWLSSKPKGTLPEPTPLEVQRSKQIQQLKNFHQKTLPPRFPVDKPMVKVNPSVKHPWVDDMMNVTGCPSVNNFAVHSDLGKAVKEIIDEFQRNPPVKSSQNLITGNKYSPYPITAQQKNDTYSAYTGAYNPPFTGSFTASYPGQVPMPTLPPSTSVSFMQDGTSQSSSNSQSSMGKPGLPVSSVNYSGSIPQATPVSQGSENVPVILPELQGLSESELQSLLDDDSKLEMFVMSLPPVQRLKEEKESIIQSNQHQAIENLSKKPILEEKKKVILEKYEYLNELKHTFDGNSQKQDEFLRGYSPQAVQDRLKIAAMQAEEESEAIAENFLEGKMQMEDFRKSYMAIRKLSHLRKAKEEKLHTVLLQYGKT